MKIAVTIAKVLTALAAIAGVLYIIATYGDKIVSWAKELLGKYIPDCCEGCDCNVDGECTCECECEDCDCCDCEDDACECEEGECCCGCHCEEAAEEAPAAEENDFEG